MVCTSLIAALALLADRADIQAQLVRIEASADLFQPAAITLRAVDLVAQRHFDGVRTVGMEPVIALKVALGILVKLVTQVKVTHILGAFVRVE